MLKKTCEKLEYRVVRKQLALSTPTFHGVRIDVPDAQFSMGTCST